MTNKHPHNQDKSILQDDMTKQTPTQSRQNNITRSHVKTNTNSMKTKQYYKITCQNKHPHYQDKTILQDHLPKQTPTLSRQNNVTRLHVKNKHPHNQDKIILQDQMTKQTPTQSRQNNITRWHDKRNTHTIEKKQYYPIHMSKQTPTQSKQNNIIRTHVKTNTHTIKTK